MTSEFIAGLKRARQVLMDDNFQHDCHVVRLLNDAIKAEEAKMQIMEAHWGTETNSATKPASPFKPGGQYRTRDGREARVYATDGDNGWPIHGAIKVMCGAWEIARWRKDGGHHFFLGADDDLMPPTRKVTKWLNVHVHNGGAYPVLWATEAEARQCASMGRVVCAQPISWEEPA